MMEINDEYILNAIKPHLEAFRREIAEIRATGGNPAPRVAFTISYVESYLAQQSHMTQELRDKLIAAFKEAAGDDWRAHTGSGTVQ